jgi:hypothetical protein
MKKHTFINNDGSLTKHIACWRFLFAAVIAIAVLFPDVAFAQVPPRFYWKSLMGTKAVPLIPQVMSGNANPLDPAHTVSAETQFDATLFTGGFGMMIPLFKRPALVALLVPMGRVSSVATIAGRTVNEQASGYGDPLLEVGVNLIGSKPIMRIPDLLRYQPKFSLDLIVDLAFPIGEYDAEQTLNLGQNRWYGRVGAPVVWQIGRWVPGRRTTLELFPSVWFFSDNSDFAGKTLKTDPMFQVEGHLTRDFTEHFWGSLDGTWVTGGKASIDDVEGTELNNLGAGFTLGYQINDNLQLTAGYIATINDSDPDDLRMDIFRFSLVYGWHKIIEGMKRLKGEE